MPARLSLSSALAGGRVTTTTQESGLAPVLAARAEQVPHPDVLDQNGRPLAEIRTPR
jgi:hypothetical protein